MELKEIKEILENAFTPYNCGVEDFEFKRRIKFRIADDDNNEILVINRVDVKDINTEISLNRYIVSIKKKINLE